MVADGAGGHQAGEIASGYLAGTVRDIFASQAYRLRVGYAPERDDYFILVIKEILEQCNEAIYSQSVMRQDQRGMASTVCLGLIHGDRLYLGHVGDSRCYLARGGKLQQLTQDHSWVQQQVASGLLTPSQAAQSGQKNLLLRAMGNDITVRVDRAVHPVQAGDVLLFCTDGLTNMVSDAELQVELLAATSLDQTCLRLVTLANQRGAPDNVSVVLARLSSEPVRAATQTRSEAPVVPPAQPPPVPRTRKQVGYPSAALIACLIVGLVLGLMLGAIADQLGWLEAIINAFRSLIG